MLTIVSFRLRTCVVVASDRNRRDSTDSNLGGTVAIFPIVSSWNSSREGRPVGTCRPCHLALMPIITLLPRRGSSRSSRRHNGRRSRIPGPFSMVKRPRTSRPWKKLIVCNDSSQRFVADATINSKPSKPVISVTYGRERISVTGISPRAFAVECRGPALVIQRTV